MNINIHYTLEQVIQAGVKLSRIEMDKLTHAILYIY